MPWASHLFAAGLAYWMQSHSDDAMHKRQSTGVSRERDELCWTEGHAKAPVQRRSLDFCLPGCSSQRWCW
uniref:Putative secreted protein n=1 Tax=Anopheles marajoara TaxID=58244 RepID=A0A2M4CEG7_9DIPT